MSDLSTEGRLELIKQVKSSYSRNRFDMSNRERLLYGKQTQHKYDMEKNEYGNFLTEPDFYTNPENSGNTNAAGMFKVRLIAGILLFFLLFAIDSGNFDFAGYAPEEIFDAISYDYISNLDEMISNLD